MNSLSGFRPVSLIATINEQGVSNLGVFSNIVHLGADPALIAFINRPREAAPHTIRNIEIRGKYTINVAESRVQMGLELSEIIPLKNGTFLVVGNLVNAYVSEEALGNDGFINLAKTDSLVSLGLDGYYQVNPLQRYTYAKPDKAPGIIPF